MSRDTIILCGDLGEDCWNCGGSRRAGDGPFEDDGRFCSADCFEEYAEIARQMEEQVNAGAE